MGPGLIKSVMKHKTTLLLCVTGLTVILLGTFMSSARATDLNIDPNANAGSELVQITIPERYQIISFTAPDLSGTGINTDPYITENAGFDADVKLFGPGYFTIRDQHGAILTTYNKTSPGVEDVKLHLALTKGVGDYELIADFADLGDHSKVHDTARIHVRWKVFIGPPGTGYYYFGGYAIAQPNFWSSATIFTLIAVIIYLLVRNRKSKKTKQFIFVPVATPKTKAKSKPRKPKIKVQKKPLRKK
jgi:hypothetical protein